MPNALISELREYPENKRLFKDLSKEDYDALKKDVMEYGIKTPLQVKRDGMVLCGHQRLKVAKDLGFTEVPVDYVSPADDEEYVIKDNLLRRHITKEERASLYSALAKKYANRLGKNQYSNSEKASLPDGKTSELISKELYGDVSKARNIENYMAYDKIIKENPEYSKYSLHQVLKKVSKEQKLKKLKDEVGGLIVDGVHLQDALKYLSGMEDASITMGLIDPPYAIDFKSYSNWQDDNNDFKDEMSWDYFEDCVKETHRILKNDAHFYVFCSFHNVGVFKSIIEKYFSVKNILVWVKNNHTPADFNYNYGHQYELIIFATKGSRPLNFFSTDVLNFNNVINKKHSCQKPVDLLKRLIAMSSFEGDTVIDYFAGSGMTGVACKELGRKYVLVERDETFYNMIKEKLK